MPKKRYSYIDNMKFAACILVALGHFFMSMTAQNVLPYTNIYNYLIKTLYTFHVPIFFVCSGFLYQKANHITSFGAYKKGILKKLLDLGVPYFTFTAITLLLKTFFSGDVTTKASPFWDTMFVHPTAPYWYLYSLFLMFLLIPCMKNKKNAGILFGLALTVKVAYVIIQDAGISLSAENGFWNFIILRLTSVANSALWFCGGMLLAFLNEEKLKKAGKILSLPLLASGIVLSALIFKENSGFTYTQQFIIGLIFVLFTYLTSIVVSPAWLNRLSFKFSDYFMPVFVMHTICAAAVRTLLFHIGIQSFILHFIGGMIGSFLIPIIVYMVCKMLTPLMFFFYPSRTIKILKGKKNGKNKVSA